MKKLKKILRAAEIAVGTGMFLLEQSDRLAPRVRARVGDSVQDLRHRANDAYEAIADRVSSMTRRKQDHSALLNAVRFATGVGIGVGVGLLIAPAKGEKTRSRIAEKAQEIGGNVRHRFNREGQRFRQQEVLRATGTGD